MAHKIHKVDYNQPATVVNTAEHCLIAMLDQGWQVLRADSVTISTGLNSVYKGTIVYILHKETTKQYDAQGTPIRNTKA